MEKIKEILEKTRSREINGEQALEDLDTKTDLTPSLVNDDGGRWALSFDGFQNVPDVDGPTDISIMCFVGAEDWKDSIYEAIVHKLEQVIKEYED